MTKKIFIVLLALGMSASLSSCSSSGKGGDGDDGAATQETADDFGQQSPDSQAQVSPDGNAAQADASPQDNGQDLALDGQSQAAPDTKAQGQTDELALDDAQQGLPEDAAGKQPADPNAVAATDAQPPPTDAPPADAQPMPPPVADNAADSAAGKKDGAPPTDEPLFNNSGAKPEETAAASTEPAAPRPPPAPYVKMKEAAFDKAGTKLNRIYVGRAGDTVKAVSQKIYGKDRAKDLKAWNPMIAGKRGVKVGDKIYFQSPTNPDDEKMLTFYEDQGIQPQIYTSKEGDDIRKLAKNLLGSKENWKEIWATNLNVESKGLIPAGLELKYWPSEAVAAAQPPVKPEGDTAMTPPPPPPDMNNMPPPTNPQPIAKNDVPPPPPPPPPPAPPTPASTPDMAASGAAAGAMGNPEPPPPPPPPPVEPMKPMKPMKPVRPVAIEPEGDQDMMMIAGVGGILLMAAAVLFVVLRKNRAKRIDLSQTQV